MGTTDNISKEKKKGLKTVAETAATTATIVVSGKTIASVIDSGVDAIKELEQNDAVAEPEKMADKDIEDKHQVPEATDISKPLRAKLRTPTVNDDAENAIIEGEDIADIGNEDGSVSLPDTEMPVDSGEENDIQVLGTEPIDDNIISESMQVLETELENATVQMAEKDDLHSTMDTEESYGMAETYKEYFADEMNQQTDDLQDMSFGMDNIAM